MAGCPSQEPGIRQTLRLCALRYQRSAANWPIYEQENLAESRSSRRRTASCKRPYSSALASIRAVHMAVCFTSVAGAGRVWMEFAIGRSQLQTAGCMPQAACCEHRASRRRAKREDRPRTSGQRQLFVLRDGRHPRGDTGE